MSGDPEPRHGRPTRARGLVVSITLGLVLWILIVLAVFVVLNGRP